MKAKNNAIVLLTFICDIYKSQRNIRYDNNDKIQICFLKYQLQRS